MDVERINSMNPIARSEGLGNKIASALGWTGWYEKALIEHIFVSPQGNDANSGYTPKRALLTIQKAIDKASTTKHTVVHLMPKFSAANTIDSFTDESVAAASVASGNERLINAAIYIYKSNMYFVGEGPSGSVKIAPPAACSAGIVAIKDGMANISFFNVAFDATTAAFASIKSRGEVENLTIQNCTFKLGTIQLDLDADVITNPVIVDNEFWDADTDFLTIAPSKGIISDNNIGFSVYLSAGGKITSGITLANTAGTGGTRIKDNVIQGGDDGGTNDVITDGILIAGSHTRAASIIGNIIANCDDQIDDSGTDTLIANNFSEAGGTDATDVALDKTHLKT